MIPATPSDPPRRVLPLPDGAVGVTEEGEGSPVVAVHGLPGSVRDFRWLGAALDDRVRLVRIEVPGFGGSATRRDRSLRSRAEAIAQAVTALGIDRYVVVGHSMGGPVAAALALADPGRVVGLGLLASVGPIPHAGLRSLPVSPWVLSWLLAAPPGRWLRPRVRHAFGRMGFQGVTDAMVAETLRHVAATGIPEHARNLSQLRVPTLVAWCADDPIVEGSVSEALYWAAPAGPRIRFEDGGHNLQESRSVELAESIVAWITTLEHLF